MAGTSVYVDGFNLYYGAVKDTPYKWLDIPALLGRLLPDDRIERIRYFTAWVKGRPDDPGVQARQQAFVRALRTNPLVELHLGSFRTDSGWFPIDVKAWPDIFRPDTCNAAVQTSLAPLLEGLPRTPKVRAIRTEEKGSDVNLASWLLHDVYLGGCRKALVVSDDGDLEEPVRLAVAHGATVGVANPHRSRTLNRKLAEVASFAREIRSSVIAECQMPPTVTDNRGRQIHRPRVWAPERTDAHPEGWASTQPPKQLGGSGSDDTESRVTGQ